MKKLITITLLSALLAATMVSTAAASWVGSPSHQANVTARYEQTSEPSSVYSVDIIWGKMEFTYSVHTTRTWNSATNSYQDDHDTKWQSEGNEITVVNHSNRPVTAEFAFQPVDSAAFRQFDLSFNVTRDTLEAGVINAYDQADSLTTVLTPSGKLANTVTDMTKAGSVTVSLLS